MATGRDENLRRDLPRVVRRSAVHHLRFVPMKIETHWLSESRWLRLGEVPRERQLGVIVTRTEVQFLDVNAHYKHRYVYLHLWWGTVSISISWGVRPNRINGVPLA